MNGTNFSGELAQRCSCSSCLVNAKTGETITDLPRLIAQSGGFFLEQGLEPGDRIVIACRLTPASVLAYLGAIYAGLVAVPIDSSILTSSAATYVELTGARALWSENGTTPPVGIRPDVLWLCADFTKSSGGAVPPEPRESEDLAALMPTSGTTGAPRFVMVSHGNLMANTAAIVRSQRIGEGENAMLILPLSYCFGASILHSHLYCGGSVVLDSRFMFPDKVLRSASEYGCTTFAGVPSVYKILLSRSSISTLQIPGLRRVIQAGGHLEWRHIELFTSLMPNVPFYVMYGQTEATSRITCLEPERLLEKKGSVGRPLDNLSLRIVDDAGVVLPPHKNGFIQVCGPSVCHGYWNDPEGTRKVFRDGWLNTNDSGKIDEEGYVWIEGRNGDFLKVRGKRLSFGEIEQKVLCVKGVREAATCAVLHEEAGEAPALFVVLEDGVSHEEMVNRIKRSLPSAWTCEKIRIMDHLPLTDRGKLDRAALICLATYENP
ncbi:MAG: class I adenylate-forming enzyme family protein [Pelobacteraceae bacterium]